MYDLVLHGETYPDIAIPLNAQDFEQPATFPLLTHMWIKGVADDNAGENFPWPFMVKNDTDGFGITVDDVLKQVWLNFQEYVRLSESERWEWRKRARAGAATHTRNAELRKIYRDPTREVDAMTRAGEAYSVREFNSRFDNFAHRLLGALSPIQRPCTLA